RHTADRHKTEMQCESKARLVARLGFFQFFYRGRHIFCRFRIASPIGQKTVAKIFVDHALVRFDDFFARRDPATDQRRQSIAGQAATQRSEILDVGNEEPAWHVRDLSNRAFGKCRSIIVGYFLRLMKNKEAVANDDLILVTEPDRLMQTASVQ